MSPEIASHQKVVIIGSGPAGYTAAIYAARANLAPLLFEGLTPGGQLTWTTDVENFPGYPDGVMGPEMMEQFKAQAQRFGTQILPEHVTSVDLTQRPFTLKTDNRTITADALIISTGATAKLLGLPSENQLMGHGVSACATCDGFFFRGKEVVVVGGGDSAMEEANFLTRFATKVTLIHRRREFRASKIMVDRARNNPKIDFIYDSAVEEIIGTKESGVTAIRLKNLITHEVTDYPTQGVFVAIGHQPNTQLFKDSPLQLDEAGYILTQQGTAHTNLEGVFACGDVQDHRYRQAITAAGSGCMAAIDAERYLEALEAKEGSLAATH